MKTVKFWVKKLLCVFGIEISRSRPRNINLPKYFKKMLCFQRMFEIIKNVEGDVVECGVAAGYSLLQLSILVAEESKNRKIYGFDSFEGLPDSGDMKHTITDVKYTFKRFNGHFPVLTKGFFKDTLAGFQGKIALLHLDCDLAESYKTCLRELYPQIVKRGVIIFDEYDNPKWPGVKEVIESFGIKVEKDISGKYYFVK